uniref:Uncharacterized protein n=1 Tax=Arundo donax TaxID=35708 RepID=A0A0A9U238_ARUDO
MRRRPAVSRTSWRTALSTAERTMVSSCGHESR